ncbi:MAG: GxxExxY protein [Limisphaerales bacterium]
MPVTIRTSLRRLSQAEFGDLAYSVMGCVFQIHREFGRFFDEKIYKRELALRHPGVELEVPIEITHGSFRKTQYMDVLVERGGLFEFKAVEAIVPRHQAQLLHYMLLAELWHGKLVNLRNESVQHEFVNTSLTRSDRIDFEVADHAWCDTVPGAAKFREVLTTLLLDWGTGLDVQLYDEALVHFLGGVVEVLQDVKVRTAQHKLGHQRLRLAAPRVAFAVTTLPGADPNYEEHAHRFVSHTDLDAVLWANIELKRVTFTTVT